MLEENVKTILVRQITEVLSGADKEYKVKQIEYLLDRWYSSKENLINILRKHPNWNEETFSIEHTIIDTRNIDIDGAQARYLLIGNVFRQKGLDVDLDVFNHIYHNISQTVSYKLSKTMEGYKIKVAVGKKMSRFINEFFTSYDPNNIVKEYNTLFASLSDMLNPLARELNFSLSVHPCDYLTMSCGTGWSSCHNLDNGEYSVGTLSYMNDETSMIMYTTSINDHNDYSSQKVDREVFCYENGILLQSRLYPKSNDSDRMTLFGDIVKEIISKCEGCENSWTTSSNSREYINTHIDALHYEDYRYSSFDTIIYLLPTVEEDSKIDIGSKSQCIICGEILYEPGDLCCEKHKLVECEECGQLVHPDDLYYVDGFHYCEDCCTLCYYCDEYVKNIDTEIVNGNNICTECIKDNYTWCDNCSEYICNDNKSVSEYISCGNHSMICESCAGDIGAFFL